VELIPVLPGEFRAQCSGTMRNGDLVVAVSQSGETKDLIDILTDVAQTWAEAGIWVRFRRSEVVLKKFGLVPRDFDLRTFLVGLLREQIAGYYDPATKTVNLLDWVDAEQQKPVKKASPRKAAAADSDDGQGSLF